MNKRPSLIKIMTIDYMALSGWLFPVVIWGLYIFLVVTGRVKTSDFGLPAIFAAITMAALGFLLWRIQLFNTIFSDGIETAATISNISFFRDRGRVEYIFIYQGQKYMGGNGIHKVKQTQALRVGQQVSVMVDRNNPKRAFIRDLYL